jgi:cytochrome b561
MTVIGIVTEQHGLGGSGGGHTRYTRVAIYLHWAIAIMILYNLLSGFLIWDLAKPFFKANRPLYFLGLITHMSSGFTILALTVARIAWRLLNAPPPHPGNMKAWEQHASHFAHFLLYAGMVLMPLTGWAILSAHPPAGSPGAKLWVSPMAPPPGATPGAKPAGPPPAPRIWFVLPMPIIGPIADIGREPGGVEPQSVLHEEFVEWHETGGYMMLILLLLHVAGALKHQFFDKEPELERMGWGSRKSKPR